MSTETGTFISMDTYEGSIYDPDSLHKYLYANGNPVKYNDPSGNMASLSEMTSSLTIGNVLRTALKINLQGVISGSVCGAFSRVTGGTPEEIKESFITGYKIGVGIGALRCFVVGYKIVTLARFFVLSATANFIFNATVTIYAIVEGCPELAITFAVLTVLSVGEWCYANKCCARVEVCGDNGNATFDFDINGEKSGYYQDSNGRWHRPNGQFASNKEMGIETPAKTTTETHGNSLSDTRTNYGYALVDVNTNEILKFGETLYPESRYSQSFLNENNAKMIIMEKGSKIDIHLWQHDMNEYYYNKYNKYPPMNSKGW